MVLFRYLSDGVLLRVHSERFLFESSVIGSSSGSSAIDSSLGSSVFFFRHDASFFQNMLLLFLLLKHILFYIIFSKRTSHLTISSEKKCRNTCMIQTRNIIFVLKIYVINFPIYKLSVLLNILHEKSNKVFQEPDWLLFHFET